MTSRGIPPTHHRMRTTLDLPEDLIEEARRLLGFKSKTDTIVLALRELVRRHRIGELKDLLGSVDYRSISRSRGGARAEGGRDFRGYFRGG